MREKILQHYKENYSSSPIEISDDKIEVLISNDCECYHCSKSIFELYDFPEIEENTIYCEDCYREEFMATCPICEDYFVKATTALDEKIIVTKEASKELGLDKAGFYQVLKYPYTFGNILSGVGSLRNDSLELIRECDINSMLKKIDRNHDEITSGECCHECVDKYTGKTKIINNYVDKEFGKKYTALQRKVIKLGM